MALVLETIDGHGTPAGRVLDVGCGTGSLLERLAERGCSGVGIDLSPDSVALAAERLRAIGADDRLEARVGSAYEPPEGPYDLIALTDVLEHLEEPRACLRALRERLAPGGLLVVSTPNRRSLPGARRWIAERWPRLGIRLSLAPVDNWQTWADLESHGAAAGLVAVSRRGIFFRPGGRIGSQLGRLYRLPALRRAELRLSRTPMGRFGFYVCVGFRPV
jgi:2-polyprenyl-6-hydroxyphenyl methylase/3-demethylubiquinone-9 3-methyltransferase